MLGVIALFPQHSPGQRPLQTTEGCHEVASVVVAVTEAVTEAVHVALGGQVHSLAGHADGGVVDVDDGRHDVVGDGGHGEGGAGDGSEVEGTGGAAERGGGGGG